MASGKNTAGSSRADGRQKAADLEKRLRELDQHARELERELSHQRAELAKSREALQEHATRREELVADAERARNIDASSGLPNRAAFVHRLEARLPELLRAGVPVTVLVVGIDRLSTLRQSLGFGTADQVAQRIGERVLNAVADIAPQAPPPEAGRRTARAPQAKARPNARSAPKTAPAPEPSPGLTLVARTGDDEFALALSSAASVGDAAQAALRLIEVIDGPMRIGGTDMRLMATVGVAQLPEHGKRAEALLANAQAALRDARERGLHGYEFFRESIAEEGARRVRLEAELRRGLDQREFSVHYQPLVRLRGRRVVGVEALLRWNHPERGLLAAGAFIDVAIDTGLIAPIGESVVRQACRDAAAWPGKVGLSVNLSAREFRGARVEAIVESALEQSGLAPGRLSVELAEASLHGDATDVALVRMTALRERGVQLILDNVGAGTGGLDLLRRCRADVVKISPQLIAAVDADKDVFAVVRAIAALARQLGATVIAQGIERKAQLDAALRAGCTLGQGYYLGSGMTADKLARLLRTPAGRQ